MNVIRNPRIWEIDVDDTLVCWDTSQFEELDGLVTVGGFKNSVVRFIPNQKNVNLLIKLSKVGWFIRVHSGSGAEWAEIVVQALGLQEYVDEVCAKPLGRTDDRPAGDGVAYEVFRNPKTGKETTE